MKTFTITVESFLDVYGMQLDIDFARSLSAGLEQELLGVNGVSLALREPRGCDMRFHVYLSTRLDTEDIDVAHREILDVCERREASGAH